MNKTFICSICEQKYPVKDRTVMGDQELCPDCLAEETLICSCCGKRIWKYDNAGTEDIPLCQDCRDHCYTECSHCGRLIRSEDVQYLSDDPEDDEEPLCTDCYSRSARENHSRLLL